MFGIVLATGSLLVSVWVLPPPEYTASIAMLNESLQAGPFPTNVTVYTNISLNIEVSNFLGVVQYFYVRTKLANASSLATANAPSSAPILLQFERILRQGGTWRIPIELNMSTPGINHRLTFELWRYDAALQTITYTGLWTHLPLNVTGP